METVENEVWLLLEDGRLISMNHVAAPEQIASGRAQLIPPERVVREEGAFVLLDEDDPRVAEGKAAAEKAAEQAAKDAAAAEEEDEEDEETEAPAPVESAAVAPPEKAAPARASTRKPA